MNQIGIFNESDRLKRLSEMGDPLEKAAKITDWEMFRPTLKAAFAKEERGLGGRPAWDYVLMFKIMLLQKWYGIADDKAEYVINDRLSFQRFLGLSLGDKIPDAKTIWLFRDGLSKTGADRKLFTMFEIQMEKRGIITRKGSIVDATFVDAPRQRNKREENKTIKESSIPEEWEKPENKAKFRQKDTDARWTKRNGETHYGYKDHVKVDKDSKMIVAFSVTDASVHDSNEIVGLTDEKDDNIWADSAYAGEELQDKLKEKNKNIKLHINEKGYRNHPLTEEQKANNREKSKVRARVEHPFGYMTNSMGGIYVNSIGKRRAVCACALMNLAYNISRYIFLMQKAKLSTQMKG